MMPSRDWRQACLALLASLLSLTAGLAQAEDIRAEEIAHCAPGDISTWPDGQDRASPQSRWRFAYRPEQAPPWLPEASVRRLIERALTAWSPCGIPLTLLPQEPRQAAPDLVVLTWDEAGSRGNFGLADLGQRRLWLGPSAFALLHERNPGHDAQQTLQMVLAHELGHFLGLLAHSRRCVDVLSYYHDGHGNRCLTRQPGGVSGAVEFRSSLPTACDIARCRAINGMPH